MSARSIKKILVRGPNWIGDAVLSEPALSAVGRMFPEAEVTLLVHPSIADLFQGHPGVQHLEVYDHHGIHKGISGKWALAQTLRRRRFDLAILFQNAFEAALGAFLSGIPWRYGYARDGRSFMLTDAIPVTKETAALHQVHYYLDLVKPLGMCATVKEPHLYVSAQERGAMHERLAEWGVGTHDKILGINPGSLYGGAKRWLPTRFAETADRVVKAWQEAQGVPVRVLIVGAKGEEELGQAIATQMQLPPLVLSGKTTIRELMAVVTRCDLFLTNDTGPMHLATALGVPVVAVFGPTDWRTTAPVGGDHRVVRHHVECAPCLLRECPIDHRCMTQVTVDQVSEAAAGLLPGVPTQGGAPALRKLQGALKGVTVFVDRDGTINHDRGYLADPMELELFPGAVEAVARLNHAGAHVVLITNQSGIARGVVTHEGVATIHHRLQDLLARGGAHLDAIFYCPHHPDDGCHCRKPEPGLIEQAATRMALDLSRTMMIGDQKRDMDLGRKVGAIRIMVRTGPTSEIALDALKAEHQEPDCVASSLEGAVQWVLESGGSTHNGSRFFLRTEQSFR